MSCRFQSDNILLVSWPAERMGIVFQALRFARVCLEESFLWAHSRQTFGKKLIEHPVIRAKIAEMARQVEATQAMTELLTYQMKTIPREHVRLWRKT